MTRGATLLFLSALIACGSNGVPEETSPPAGIIQELQAENSITTDVNAKAPAFVRVDYQGKVIRTQDYIGRRVLLLDFWSVFCKSCLEEMPFLKELYGRYRDQGLEVVGINTDFFPPERIMRFLEKTRFDLPYPLILDRDQTLSRLFHVEALPVTVLIDSSGWIRMVHLGYQPGDRSMIESRVRKACRKIKETVVTLQPVGGRTAFAPQEKGSTILPPGSPAPDFEASDGRGNTYSFSSFRGNSPSLLLFWSLFCKPCREEFAHLTRLSRNYSSQGLKILAVNIDSPKLHPAAIRFLEKTGVELNSVFDTELEGGRYLISSLFGVSYTPSIFLVAPDGTIRSSFPGEVEAKELEDQVQQLLSEPQAAKGTPEDTKKQYGKAGSPASSPRP